MCNDMQPVPKYYYSPINEETGLREDFDERFEL
jgi:hypothetical protein